MVEEYTIRVPKDLSRVVAWASEFVHRATILAQENKALSSRIDNLDTYQLIDSLIGEGSSKGS